MTLELLNEHLHLLWELQSARERLEALRASVLGAQKYDGMPHASGVSDKVALMAIAMTDQEADVNRLEKMIKKSGKSVKKYVDGITDNRTKLIFNLRFCCGMTWAEVAQAIGGRNTPETVKMACYRYLTHEQSVKD